MKAIQRQIVAAMVLGARDHGSNRTDAFKEDLGNLVDCGIVVSTAAQPRPLYDLAPGYSQPSAMDAIEVLSKSAADEIFRAMMDMGEPTGIREETLEQIIERGYRVLDKHTGTSDYEDGCRLVLDRVQRWIQDGGSGHDVDPSIRKAATEAASALYYEDIESTLKESLVSILRTLVPQYFEDSEDLNDAELRAMLLELDPGSFAEDVEP